MNKKLVQYTLQTQLNKLTERKNDEETERIIELVTALLIKSLSDRLDLLLKPQAGYNMPLKMDIMGAFSPENMEKYYARFLSEE